MTSIPGPEVRESDSAVRDAHSDAGADSRAAARREEASAAVAWTAGSIVLAAIVGGVIGGGIDAIRFEAAFRADAERRVSDAASRLAAKLWVSYAFRGFFLGSENVTASEFQEFADWLRVADPEIRTCAFLTATPDASPDASPDAPSRFEITLRSPPDSDLGSEFVAALARLPDWSAALETAERDDRICILALEAAGATARGWAQDELALLLPVGRTRPADRERPASGFVVSTFRSGSLLRPLAASTHETAKDAQLFLLNPDRAPGERVVVDLAAAGREPPPRYSRSELERWASATAAWGAARDLAPELSRLRLVCLDPAARSALRFEAFGLVGTIAGALVASVVALVLRRRSHLAQRMRARLEELVDRRTADLEAANADLEAFAHTVSHDLRAPLRAIEGFSTELRESLGSVADPTQLRQLETLTRNSARASEIVAGLLALSKWTRVPLELRPLDTPTVVSDAVDEARRSRPDDKVRVTVGNLPKVRGDSRLVRQLFVNLISNAVKYTRGRDDASVEIRGEPRGREVEFEVRDNGIGFDPKFAARLFQPFQRLPNAREFDGSGIGLALAARIVARHGGRIVAEGRLGEGAVFRFTLPADTDRRNDETASRAPR